MAEVGQPTDSTKVVETLLDNIKGAMEQYRLDASSFISGLKFLADAPRELADGQLIPEVVNACVEVAAEHPSHSPVAVKPGSDYIEELLLENVVLASTAELNAVLSTVVTATAISATCEALTPAIQGDVTVGLRDAVITALKEAGLMPADRESAVYERVERICQCIREVGTHMPQLAAQGEGLTYAERRNMVAALFSVELVNALRAESRRQDAQTAERLVEKMRTSLYGRSMASDLTFSSSSCPEPMRLPPETTLDDVPQPERRISRAPTRARGGPSME